MNYRLRVTVIPQSTLADRLRLRFADLVSNPAESLPFFIFSCAHATLTIDIPEMGLILR